ncbi:MAG TPA: hypothetical protein VNT50_13935, partial [Microbacterium sp.]|nr:hypothetical protein [Microbacterium sp.]
MLSVRSVLVGLGVAFTAYLAARGLWGWTQPLELPIVLFVALAFYLVTTWLCLFAVPKEADPKPGAHPAVRGPAVMPAW